MSFEVEIGDGASAIVQLEVTSDVKVDALSFAKCLGAFKVHSVSISQLYFELIRACGPKTQGLHTISMILLSLHYGEVK